MPIDINGISSTKIHGPTDDSQLKKPVEQPAQQMQSEQSSTSDTVSLSDDAVQLGKIDNTSVAAPVIDTQRVEQVKKAIADGSYEVDPAKVADKLMQFESMLKPKA